MALTLRNSSNPAQSWPMPSLMTCAPVFTTTSALFVLHCAPWESPLTTTCQTCTHWVAPRESRNGKARLCTLRPAQALDHVPTAIHLQQAQARTGSCAGCPRGVAHEIIEQSRGIWQIGVEV